MSGHEPGTLVRLLSPDGNTVNGWFRVHRYHPNGDVTLWGPCNQHGTTLQSAQWRSVKPHQIGAVSTRKTRP